LFFLFLKMQITTRLAKLEDVPRLNELIALSVRGLSIAYYTSTQIESAIKYIFGIDTQLIFDGTYYIAEKDNIVVGCGGWSKRNTLYGGDQHKETEDPLLNPGQDAARIRAFFVHPNYARQGICRLIINVCETEARGEGLTVSSWVLPCRAYLYMRLLDMKLLEELMLPCLMVKCWE
jgi:GNAT superfamily N-acetyltransferase